MAKYIRTKDGIIYVGDLIKDDYGNYCDPKNYETDIEVSNEYIIKEADTIEELCDYFLIDKNDIEHYEPTTLLIFDDYDDFRYSMFGYEFASGYGCIKTDRGLIYVAKFNWEDEELELCQN